jgi:hypothetical protein
LEVNNIATIKVITIKADLNACLEYASNPDKTTEYLADSLGYIADGEKTQEARFVSALNCSTQGAYEQMARTKRRWKKENKKRLGYHIIQSFEPGEIMPEKAHKIGRELAAKVFGDFEVVIATHIDKEHIHNHIVFNSVSFKDGRMYHDEIGKREYYKSRVNVIQKTSDELCKQYELSIVHRGKYGEKGTIEYSDPGTGERVTKPVQGMSRSRAEWNASKAHRPTVRDKVRADIDEIIVRSGTWEDFISNLRKSGYAVRVGQGELKHFAIRTPSGTKIRFSSLGEGYGEEDIKERIRTGIAPIKQRTQPNTQSETKTGMRSGTAYLHRQTLKRTRTKLLGIFPTRKMSVKLYGFKALYFRYLYTMGKIPVKKNRPVVRSQVRRARYMVPEVKKLNRIMEQERFLRHWKIDTTSELSMFSDAVNDEIYRLTRERKQLYNEKRIVSATSPETVAAINGKIAELNTEIKERRKQLDMCKRVETDSKQMEETISKAKAFAEQPTERTPIQERNTRYDRSK